MTNDVTAKAPREGVKLGSILKNLRNKLKGISDTDDTVDEDVNQFVGDVYVATKNKSDKMPSMDNIYLNSHVDRWDSFCLCHHFAR